MLSSGSSDLQSRISTATSLDEDDEETAKILRNAKQSILVKAYQISRLLPNSQLIQDAMKAAVSTVALLPIPDTSVCQYANTPIYYFLRLVISGCMGTTRDLGGELTATICGAKTICD
jgi:hypothetical protein